MRTRFRAPISTALAIAIGVIVLLGYFIDLPVLANLRKVFLSWGVILAAVALVVGVVNLLSVHARKVSSGQPGRFYSLVLLISLVLTIAVTGFLGPTAHWSLWIFNYIQTPVESSLMAILVVTLAYASVRLVRRRFNWVSVLFLGTVIIVLLGTAPLLGIEVPGLHGPTGLRALITSIPAVAGARGILLGVALGTVATGLRVLMGADRPYGG